MQNINLIIHLQMSVQSWPFFAKNCFFLACYPLKLCFDTYSHSIWDVKSKNNPHTADQRTVYADP